MSNLRSLIVLSAVAVGSFASTVWAQPTVGGSQGTWTHGGSVTISGANFGQKATPAPLIWDDASGTNVLEKWDGFWPNVAADSTNNMAYRTPIRGIQPPHSRTGRYLAGNHAVGGLATSGSNVLVWKQRPVSYPSSTYLSWYQRMDDNWTFGDDDNFKNYVVAQGPEPYVERYWYAEYNSRPTSRTSGCNWTVFDSGSLGLSPAMNWGASCTNPMSGQWVKVELMIRWSRGSDGFVRVFDNGRKVVDYNGPTDTATGSTRVEGIGGYARVKSANNWRYYTDLYMDSTLSHVVLANASTLSSSTKREMQIPTSWNNNAITLRVNLGAFSPGQVAYLFVFDANGNANAIGTPVTIGATSTSMPMAPTGLRVLPPPGGLQ